MMACLTIAFYFKDNNFILSLFLNLFGGLSIGLLLLIYQNYRETKFKKAQLIVNKIKKISKISVYEACIGDFSDECDNRFNEESSRYVLKKYTNYLLETENHIDEIFLFSKEILRFDIDFDKYLFEVNKTIDYFKGFNIVPAQVPVPNLILKENGEEDLILYGEEGWEEEYCDTEIVLSSDNKSFTEETAFEWINLMNKIKSLLTNFNQELEDLINKVINYHDSNIN
jgi:hypothetical protein